MDWKYALHLPISDKGFDASVLCEFRARLIKHAAEACVFDRLLTQLKASGLIKHRGIQRTDSLALLTKARLLGRVELAVETIRTVVRALLKADAEWTRATLPAEWEKRYAGRCKAERLNEEERALLAVMAGTDGQWLLDQLAAAPEHIQEVPALDILRTVWAQHFVTVEDTIQFQPAGSANGAESIETPHDAEARWSRKGSASWTGYKLQVTETDDADKPHLITDIAVEAATNYDSTALPEIRERQAKRGVLPGERYADKGYIDGKSITDGRKDGEDLIGPMRNYSSPQTCLPDGFTHADFVIDFENGIVTCPSGHHASIIAGGADGHQAVFAREDCEACPLKARCVTGKKEGRSLRFGPHYHMTQFARERQKSEDFKTKYRKHRGDVEACLSALVHNHGVRICRYVGQTKNHLRALFLGAAVNLLRMAAWKRGHRPRKYKPRLGLAESGGAVRAAT